MCTNEYNKKGYKTERITSSWGTKNKKRLQNLSSYYFLVVRYFVKSNNQNEEFRLKITLSLLFNLECISKKNYLLGLFFIYLLKYKFLNKKLFLDLNRLVFKKD